MGHAACMAMIGNGCKVSVRKYKDKREFGSYRHRCVDNIKMFLRGIVWEDVDSTDLAQSTDKWWVFIVYSVCFLDLRITFSI